MLVIVNEGNDFWDEANEKFVKVGQPFTASLEHSLISVSKWEAKYQVPFLATNDKTRDQVFDYIRMMVLTCTIPVEDLVIDWFTPDNLRLIQEYIDSTQSATTFGEMPTKSGAQETITSELIYYWMVAFTIPWDAENWHLNRLFHLIRICNIKQQKPKKIPKHEMAQRYRDLNAQRKAQLGTSG